MKPSKLLNLKIDGVSINQVSTVKYLGVTFDSILTWKNHIPRFASFLEGVVPNSPRSNCFLTLNATLKTHMKYMMNFTFYFPS